VSDVIAYFNALYFWVRDFVCFMEVFFIIESFTLSSNMTLYFILLPELHPDSPEDHKLHLYRCEDLIQDIVFERG
jgi:hypothetical protein